MNSEVEVVVDEEKEQEPKKTKRKKKQTEGTAIAKVEQDSFALIDPKTFKQTLEVEEQKRELLKQYINNNLIEDVDYGTIKIGGKESKPCLFKPGAEKFCNLLKLKAEFFTDLETLSMIPEKMKADGVIAFRCDLIHMVTGQKISEGRGVCTIAEKKGIINTAVKIAEKRAKVDAVLMFGLSDSFTQDLEDTQEDGKQHQSNNHSNNKKQVEKRHVEDVDAVIWFGNYKGKKFINCSIEWLEWCRDYCKEVFPEEIQRFIDYKLKLMDKKNNDEKKEGE